MTEPLRVGIVGCGVISGTHGDGLKQLEAEGLARLVAVADVDEQRGKAFAAKYGVESHTSFDDLLKRPDIDSVTLCTPSGLHGEMAIKAAKAGKHILSEKPLDVWVEHIDKAIAATKSAGIVYGGIFQGRFSAAAKKIKRAVDAGAFGDIVLSCVETKWYRSDKYYASGDWRGTWALDAGAFSNQGIHGLDKIQWLSGPVAEVISATLCPGFHRNIEAETLGVVTVRFENGALGTIVMSTLSNDGFPERLDISGTKGCAMIVGDTLAHFKTAEPFEDDATAAASESVAGGGPTTASDPSALGGSAHLQNIRDFVLAVRDGREPLVSATEARRATNLLNMIYEKAKVGPYA